MSIIIATHFESHTQQKENGTQAKHTKSVVSGCLKKVNRQIIINHLFKPFKTITLVLIKNRLGQFNNI